MAKQEHLAMLEQGIKTWNAWRKQHREIKPDLSEADLRGWNLRGGYFSGADLREADLSYALLYNTNLRNANLTGCRVAGTDAQSAFLYGAVQIDLNISIFQFAPVIVDSLQVAQFVYLYRGNPVLQDVLDIGPSSKLVLLVGGFSEERKPILEAIKTSLRQREIIPIFYNITQEKKRNTGDVLRELVSLARYVFVDVSEPASFLGALEPILPALPAVPLHFIMQAPREEGVLEAFFDTYPWIGEPQYYDGADDIAGLVGRYMSR